MIERVWGKADNIDLELHKVGDVWEVSIPPDISDGQYAVILYALNTSLETSVWTGFLYMSGGVCHLQLDENRYSLWLQPGDISLEPIDYCYKIEIDKRCRL